MGRIGWDRMLTWLWCGVEYIVGGCVGGIVFNSAPFLSVRT